MTVDLSEGDDASLSISIKGFVANPKDPNIYFVVETTTTLETFPKRAMKVNRKHDDFLWLYERFSENADFAGYILPSVPANITKDQEKHAAAALSTADEGVQRLREETTKRGARLERFLRRLVALPKVRSDPNLVAFLDYEELQSRKTPGLFSFSSSVSAKIDTDKQFEKLRADNATFTKNISAALASFGKLVKSEQQLGDDIGAVPPSAASLSETDSNPQWASLLNQLAEVCKTSKTGIAAHVSAVEETLGDQLADSAGYANSITAMHNHRLLLLQRALTAKQNLQKAEAKAKSKPQAADEVKLLTTQEAEAQEAFRSATALAVVDVARVRSARVADHRSSLSSLAEKEITLAQSRLDNLRSILSALQA